MDSKRQKMQAIVKGIRLIESLSLHFILNCICQAVLKALAPFINIYLSAVMVNNLIKGQDIRYMLCLVIQMIVLNLICHSLIAFMDRQVAVKQNTLNIQYNWTLNKKIMEFSYSDVESHAVQAMREKIRQMEQVNNMGIRNLVSPIQMSIQSVFSIIFAFAIFCSVFSQKGIESSGSILTDFFCSAWASVILVVLIAGNLFVSLWTVSQSTKKAFNAYAGLVPINQIYTYYLDNYIDTYHSGKDIRLYRQGELIQKEMDHLIENSKIPMKKLKGIEFKYKAFGTLSAFIMNIFIYLTVGLRALAGLFPVGNIVQYLGGISQFITGFTTLSGQLALLWENAEALDLILQYLNVQGHEEENSRKISIKPQEIEFHNVSFVYPDTDKKVLDNISFSIKAGEKLAVVGTNGSGKTTMIKLLCRLYDVDEGKILLNGVNIKNIDTKSYQELFGVVFQDFQLFAFELGQNLSGSVDYDADMARSVLEDADFGMRLNSMDLDTSLYKDFDSSGVEISGGEAQKIAIARALYKQAQVLVLDEPTAALDPHAEYEVYKKLNHISKNRTAIFISHRMSSSRFCDRILVFDEGRLVQEGNHEELLGDITGKYYQLWRSQEQYYQ